MSAGAGSGVLTPEFEFAAGVDCGGGNAAGDAVCDFLGQPISKRLITIRPGDANLNRLDSVLELTGIAAIMNPISCAAFG